MANGTVRNCTFPPWPNDFASRRIMPQEAANEKSGVILGATY